MRENKFRAWHKKCKVMSEVYNTLVGEIEFHNKNYEFYNRNWVYENEHDDIIEMQYTGLKDKNGKEIYEGDVVRIVEDNRMGGIYLGAIKYLGNWGVYGFNMLDAKVIETRDFGEKAMGFLMKEFGNCFTLAEAFKYGDKSNFSIEVIGNIYENQELLIKD